MGVATPTDILFTGNFPGTNYIHIAIDLYNLLQTDIKYVLKEVKSSDRG